MVDRINVILVSRSGLGGKAEGMIEAIVGNLAGRPGIDLVLVSPLSDINEDSTDQLTLLSINSGAVVLTWTSPEQTMSDLDRIGFAAQRCPHAGDPFLPPEVRSPSVPGAGRKVYLMDLRQLGTVDELINQLDRLRTVQAVKTISLGGLASSPKRSDELTGPAPVNATSVKSTSESPSAANRPPLPPTEAGALANTATKPPGSAVNVQESVNRPPSSSSDAGLDDLIDQLDDFDV